MVRPLGFDDEGAVVGEQGDGQLVVYRSSTGSVEPYGPEDLPIITPPSGFAEAEVVMVNRYGEAVGVLYPVSADDLNGVRGFVASSGEIVVLEPAPGGDTSVASRINEAGQIAGGPARDMWEMVQFDGRAFLYDLRSGAATDLGTLPGFEGSSPWAINNGGVVVGEAWRWGADEKFEARAFLYDPIKAAMLDLNDLIPEGSGWVLSSAHDINDAGQIVGDGKIRGTLQAFLLNPLP
jgi:probable HAF family extracellular repeat protein